MSECVGVLMAISWALIGDPGAQVPTAEPGLISLSKEIRDTVSQEAHIVKAVFPNPIAVMQVFLQRIFAQVVSVSWRNSSCPDPAAYREACWSCSFNLHASRTTHPASLTFHVHVARG